MRMLSSIMAALCIGARDAVDAPTEKRSGLECSAWWDFFVHPGGGDSTYKVPSAAAATTTTGAAGSLQSLVERGVMVDLATTGNIILATTQAQTIDGVQLVAGMRVLFGFQTNPAENGVYTVASVAPIGSTQLTVFSRASDFIDGRAISGAFIIVEQGSTNHGTMWYVDNINPTTFVLGTTAISVRPLAVGNRANVNNMGAKMRLPSVLVNVGAAAADDTPGFPPGAPDFPFQLVTNDSAVEISTAAAGGSVVTLRTASAGGGQAVSDAYSTAAT